MGWSIGFNNLPEIGSICVVITEEKQIYLTIFMTNGEGAFFIRDAKTGEYVKPAYWTKLPPMDNLTFPQPEVKVEAFKPLEEATVEIVE